MEFGVNNDDAPTLGGWVKDNGYILKQAARKLVRYNGGAVLKHLQPRLKRLKFGPTPFEYDWDLLVVLDTCRADALQEVAHEYDWLPDEIPATRSCSSWSKDWMVKSFTDEWADEMARTAHVSWNPFTDHVLDPDDWLLLDQVWKSTWNEDRGFLPPRPVTENAIAAHREHQPERMIVHYQQPHAPYRTIETEPIQREQLGEIDAGRHTVWDRILDPADPLTRDDAWDGMIDNLRWALDEVELLLENVDAPDVLLTADHGEGFGEWMVWGHGPGMPFPKLITVPGVRLSATDTGSLQPTAGADSAADTADDAVEERLKALGYH